MFRKITALLVIFCLVFEQSGFAQVAPQIHIPAYLSGYLSAERFRPVHLRSFSIDPATNNINLTLDKGDAKKLSPAEVEDASRTLFRYFQIGLTLPNSMFWVNLRPDDPANIIDPYVEKTDLGRILLEADLQLKKDMAACTSPDTKEGRAYWDKLYSKAESLFGQSDMEIPTVTRPWIVPGEIIMAQSQESAYVYKATLNVMLEQDYLKDAKGYNSADARFNELNAYSSQLIREEILPKLTREVNSAKRYAGLRQVYYSLILAQWYKQKTPSSALAAVDGMNLDGLTSKQQWSKQTYYQAYKKSFERGEYNKEETVNSRGGLTIRRYFSGGIRVALTSIGAQSNFSVLNVANIKSAPDPIRVDAGPVTVNAAVEEESYNFTDAESVVAAKDGLRDGGRPALQLAGAMVFGLWAVGAILIGNAPLAAVFGLLAAGSIDFVNSIYGVPQWLKELSTDWKFLLVGIGAVGAPVMWSGTMWAIQSGLPLAAAGGGAGVMAFGTLFFDSFRAIRGESDLDGGIALDLSQIFKVWSAAMKVAWNITPVQKVVDETWTKDELYALQRELESKGVLSRVEVFIAIFFPLLASYIVPAVILSPLDKLTSLYAAMTVGTISSFIWLVHLDTFGSERINRVMAAQDWLDDHIARDGGSESSTENTDLLSEKRRVRALTEYITFIDQWTTSALTRHALRDRVNEIDRTIQDKKYTPEELAMVLARVNRSDLLPDLWNLIAVPAAYLAGSSYYTWLVHNGFIAQSVSTIVMLSVAGLYGVFGVVVASALFKYVLLDKLPRYFKMRSYIKQVSEVFKEHGLQTEIVDVELQEQPLLSDKLKEELFNELKDIRVNAWQPWWDTQTNNMVTHARQLDAFQMDMQEWFSSRDAFDEFMDYVRDRVKWVSMAPWMLLTEVTVALAAAVLFPAFWFEIFFAGFFPGFVLFCMSGSAYQAGVEFYNDLRSISGRNLVFDIKPENIVGQDSALRDGGEAEDGASKTVEMSFGRERFFWLDSPNDYHMLTALYNAAWFEIPAMVFGTDGKGIKVLLAYADREGLKKDMYQGVLMGIADGKKVRLLFRSHDDLEPQEGIEDVQAESIVLSRVPDWFDKFTYVNNDKLFRRGMAAGDEDQIFRVLNPLDSELAEAEKYFFTISYGMSECDHIFEQFPLEQFSRIVVRRQLLRLTDEEVFGLFMGMTRENRRVLDAVSELFGRISNGDLSKEQKVLVILKSINLFSDPETKSDFKKKLVRLWAEVGDAQVISTLEAYSKGKITFPDQTYVPEVTRENLRDEVDIAIKSIRFSAGTSSIIEQAIPQKAEVRGIIPNLIERIRTRDFTGEILKENQRRIKDQRSADRVLRNAGIWPRSDSRRASNRDYEKVIYVRDFLPALAPEQGVEQIRTSAMRITPIGHIEILSNVVKRTIGGKSIIKGQICTLDKDGSLLNIRDEELSQGELETWYEKLGDMYLGKREGTLGPFMNFDGASKLLSDNEVRQYFDPVHGNKWVLRSYQGMDYKKIGEWHLVDSTPKYVDIFSMLAGTEAAGVAVHIDSPSSLFREIRQLPNGNIILMLSNEMRCLDQSFGRTKWSIPYPEVKGGGIAFVDSFAFDQAGDTWVLYLNGPLVKYQTAANKLRDGGISRGTQDLVAYGSLFIALPAAVIVAAYFLNPVWLWMGILFAAANYIFGRNFRLEFNEAPSFARQLCYSIWNLIISLFITGWLTISFPHLEQTTLLMLFFSYFMGEIGFFYGFNASTIVKKLENIVIRPFVDIWKRIVTPGQVKKYIEKLNTYREVRSDSEVIAGKLGELGDRKAIQPLERYLTEAVLGDHYDVATAAERSLRQLGLNDSDLEKIYIGVFKKTGTNLLIRRNAVQILGRTVGGEAALKEFTDSGEAETLIRMAIDEAIPEISRRLKEEPAIRDGGIEQGTVSEKNVMSDLQAIAAGAFLLSLAGGIIATMSAPVLGFAGLMGWIAAGAIVLVGITGLVYQYAKDRDEKAAAQVDALTGGANDGGISRETQASVSFASVAIALVASVVATALSLNPVWVGMGVFFAAFNYLLGAFMSDYAQYEHDQASGFMGQLTASGYNIIGSFFLSWLLVSIFPQLAFQVGAMWLFSTSAGIVGFITGFNTNWNIPVGPKTGGDRKDGGSQTVDVNNKVDIRQAEKHGMALATLGWGAVVVSLAWATFSLMGTFPAIIVLAAGCFAMMGLGSLTVDVLTDKIVFPLMYGETKTSYLKRFGEQKIVITTKDGGTIKPMTKGQIISILNRLQYDSAFASEFYKATGFVLIMSTDLNLWIDRGLMQLNEIKRGGNSQRVEARDIEQLSASPERGLIEAAMKFGALKRDGGAVEHNTSLLTEKHISTLRREFFGAMNSGGTVDDIASHVPWEVLVDRVKKLARTSFSSEAKFHEFKDIIHHEALSFKKKATLIKLAYLGVITFVGAAFFVQSPFMGVIIIFSGLVTFWGVNSAFYQMDAVDRLDYIFSAEAITSDPGPEVREFLNTFDQNIRGVVTFYKRTPEGEDEEGYVVIEEDSETLLTKDISYRDRSYNDFVSAFSRSELIGADVAPGVPLILHSDLDAEQRFEAVAASLFTGSSAITHWRVIARTVEEEKAITDRIQVMINKAAASGEGSGRDGGYSAGRDGEDIPSINALKTQLVSSSSTERSIAARELEKMNAKVAVADLKEALKNEPERAVRNAIAHALGRIDMGALEDLFETSDSYVRDSIKMAISDLRRNRRDGGNDQSADAVRPVISDLEAYSNPAIYFKDGGNNFEIVRHKIAGGESVLFMYENKEIASVVTYKGGDAILINKNGGYVKVNTDPVTGDRLDIVSPDGNVASSQNGALIFMIKNARVSSEKDGGMEDAVPGLIEGLENELIDSRGVEAIARDRNSYTCAKIALKLGNAGDSRAIAVLLKLAHAKVITNYDRFAQKRAEEAIIKIVRKVIKDGSALTDALRSGDTRLVEVILDKVVAIVPASTYMIAYPYLGNELLQPLFAVLQDDRISLEDQVQALKILLSLPHGITFTQKRMADLENTGVGLILLGLKDGGTQEKIQQQELKIKLIDKDIADLKNQIAKADEYQRATLQATLAHVEDYRSDVVAYLAKLQARLQSEVPETWRDGTVEKGKEYKVKASAYFERGFGPAEHIVTIEGEHKQIMGTWYGDLALAKPAMDEIVDMVGKKKLLYYMISNDYLARVNDEVLPGDDPNNDEVFIGTIYYRGKHSVLVHYSELIPYDSNSLDGGVQTDIQAVIGDNLARIKGNTDWLDIYKNMKAQPGTFIRGNCNPSGKIEMISSTYIPAASVDKKSDEKYEQRIGFTVDNDGKVSIVRDAVYGAVANAKMLEPVLEGTFRQLEKEFSGQRDGGTFQDELNAIRGRKSASPSKADRDLVRLLNDFQKGWRERAKIRPDNKLFSLIHDSIEKLASTGQTVQISSPEDWKKLSNGDIVLLYSLSSTLKFELKEWAVFRGASGEGKEVHLSYETIDLGRNTAAMNIGDPVGALTGEYDVVKVLPLIQPLQAELPVAVASDFAEVTGDTSNTPLPGLTSQYTTADKKEQVKSDGGGDEVFWQRRLAVILQEERNAILRDPTGPYVGFLSLDSLRDFDEEEAYARALNRLNKERYGSGGPRYHVINGRTKEVDMSFDGGQESESDRVKKLVQRIETLSKAKFAEYVDYFKGTNPDKSEETIVTSILSSQYYMAAFHDEVFVDLSDYGIIAVKQYTAAWELITRNNDAIVVRFTSDKEKGYIRVGVTRVGSSKKDGGRVMTELEQLNALIESENLDIEIQQDRLRHIEFSVDRLNKMKFDDEDSWGNSKFRAYRLEKLNLARNKANYQIGYSNRKLKSYIAQRDDIQRKEEMVKKDGGNVPDTTGGIDMRALPVSMPTGVATISAIVPGSAGLMTAQELESNWLDIEKSIQSGPMPYDKLKAYAIACCSSQDAACQRAKLSACISAILELEEAAAVPTAPELKEILVVLS